MQRLALFGSDVPPDLAMLIDIARQAASACPPYAGLSAYGMAEEAEAIVASSGSIQLQRSAYERRGVAEVLVHVLSEALLHGYDIREDGVRRSLFNVAVAAYTSHSVPMRVLGATAEAFQGYGR